MTTILKFISAIFPKTKLGILFSILFAKSASVVAAEILDHDNQKMAYQFVKELKERDVLTNKEKQKLFNQHMLKWAEEVGKKLTESIVNCLRELAVNALKAEISKESK